MRRKVYLRGQVEGNRKVEWRRGAGEKESRGGGEGSGEEENRRGLRRRGGEEDRKRGGWAEWRRRGGEVRRRGEEEKKRGGLTREGEVKKSSG